MMVEITREQNLLVRDMVKDRCAAYKNWIASAVEGGKQEYAQALVKELRAYEAMYHVFKPDEIVKGE